MRGGSILAVGAAALISCATADPGSQPISPVDEREFGRAEADDETPDPWVRTLERTDKQERPERVDIEPARNAASKTVGAAIDTAGTQTPGWWNDLPEPPPYSHLLDDDRTLEGSLSVGTVSNGTVRRPVALEEKGDHHSIIERHRSRRTRWGTREMIELLETTAENVAEAHPDSTLRVGNIGRRGGGDIPWSSSHNSGRDADLAFYCERAEDGEPVEAPDLVRFDAQGRAVSEAGLVFDVERNWTLVSSLLTHPKVDIQWLFISEPLKRKLLEHAREEGEPAELIHRASKVLHQPSDAPPHADHLHLRITCPQQDRLEGCLDYGPRWEWVDWHRRELLARSLELGRAVADGDKETQLEALEFLREIRSPYAPEIALIEGLNADDPEVREEALDLAEKIPHWSATAVAESMELIEQPDRPFEVKRLAYEILRRTHTPPARRFALSRLLQESTPARERAEAARALVHVMEPALVPILIDELDEQPGTVREEIGTVLRRITGNREIESWRYLPDRRVETVAQKWRSWWKTHRDEPRIQWLRRSFARHGFDEPEVTEEAAVDALIPLLRETPDHVAYNANRMLHRVTGRWIPPETWSYDRIHEYWHSWWQNRNPRKVASRDE